MEQEWLSDVNRPYFSIEIGYYFPIDHTFEQMEVEYVETIITREILYSHIIGYYFSYILPRIRRSRNRQMNCRKKG